MDWGRRTSVRPHKTPFAFFMRFIAAFFFFYLLTALPCLDIYIKWYRRGTHLMMRKALWVIPILLVVPLAILQRGTDFNRVAEWYLWGLLTVTFTGNIYMLFDLIARFTGRRSAITLRVVGGVAAAMVLALFLEGMIRRHEIHVRDVEMEIDGLPASFDGTRIAHITDLHLGNLSPQHTYLERIVETINALQPDIVCFTGDIVHLSVDDSSPSDTILRQIEAPMGKYAVMGNHDYGDYNVWPTDAAKQCNLRLTHRLYASLGFELLLDTSVYVTKNTAIGDSVITDSIGIIGVENWGHDPFPKYGDMAQATANYHRQGANILLSHDPDHWHAEIIPRYPWVDLTLSGHTHGAQIGIDTGTWKFSPSQWIFDSWDGLYTYPDESKPILTTDNQSFDRENGIVCRNRQYLFVSRGLGYVGIPFRLGMWPEVTIITLK